LRAARAAAGLAAVPWGAGKWLGRRGRVLSDLLESIDDPGVFLGDNGGRPSGWRPRHFAAAARRGVRLLPGSDPLPFPGEHRSLAATGFRLGGTQTGVPDAARLVALLERPATRIEPYGDRERPLRFVRHQLAMQWRMRVARGAH
jgi:hypothetical protein